MKISLSWLSQYTAIRRSPSEIAEALTRAGIAVDAVVDRFRYLEGVRVGRIVGLAPHPNAPRLTVCRVETGEERPRSIVCGAPDLRVGLLVPAALPGAVLPDGTSVAETAVRGVPSEGMLCSAGELGLGADRGGLLELPAGLPVGEALHRALGLSDPVLELDLTPNRGDCLSLIGVAREVAALQGTRLRLPRVRLVENGPPVAERAAVAIEAPEACPRYVARVVEGVTIGPSPFWLQDRLLSVGMRPINNIVDVTNFVMLECGQPLHAFDLDRLADRRIVVRTARAGERFVTLDGRGRTLEEGMLLICDGRGPVAVAGVMGGLDSEIRGETTRVLIESACFEAGSVRRTAKRLGLPTEASRRFEKGVDPTGTVRAADRAAQLMAEIAGGRVARGVIDAHPRPWTPQPIRLDLERTARFLGVAFPKARIRRLLRSIGFEVAPGASRRELRVTPPPFRPDVSRPEDLAEEIARLAGFDEIPVTVPALPAAGVRPFAREELRRRLRDVLNGLGFTEVITYSFIDLRDGERLRLSADDPRRLPVALLNPIAEDQSVLRTSLLPGLLHTLRFNLDQQTRRVKIFEVGKVFLPRQGAELPAEPERLAGLWSGPRAILSWHERETPCDFYDLKGTLEALLDALHAPEVRFAALADAACDATRPGRSARILAAGEVLGFVGEIHPRVRSAFDLKQEAFVFELDLEALERRVGGLRHRQPVLRFPAAVRDLTVILDAGIEAQAVLEAIREAAPAWLEQAGLIDVFSGPPIPAGERSLTFRLSYRSGERTLEDSAVNAAHAEMTARVLARFGGRLPG
ncbi:MAG: phenylalanine--tRNA ligase subunit beta [Desulfobacterales bacterium]